MTLDTLTPKQRVLGIIAGTALLLLVPLVVMQFTSEVQWNGFDFLVAGLLLLGAGFACELVIRLFSTWKTRMLFIGLVLFVLMLVWIELAVGIFGTPWAGN
ncbi:MAG: hypothetical protein ACK4FS_01015 [Flavobacterium sp.]